jgi:hypothetical protein
VTTTLPRRRKNRVFARLDLALASAVDWWSSPYVVLGFATCTTRGEKQTMTKLFLLPGSLVCDAVGLAEDSDNRQILRTFLNTLIWGAAGVAVILLLPL